MRAAPKRSESSKDYTIRNDADGTFCTGAAKRAAESAASLSSAGDWPRMHTLAQSTHLAPGSKEIYLRSSGPGLGER